MVAASQRTSLTYAIGGRSSAVGNADYGWWFGSGPTTVNRVDYSSDTATALVRGYLQTTSPVSATYASGHGNENYGYVQGYHNTNIQRIDYANDMYLMDPSLTDYGMFLTYHGASVHFVTPDLDNGPIIIQGKIEIKTLSHDINIFQLP